MSPFQGFARTHDERYKNATASRFEHGAAWQVSVRLWAHADTKGLCGLCAVCGSMSLDLDMALPV